MNENQLSKRQCAFYEDLLLFISYLDISLHQKEILIEKVDNLLDTLLYKFDD